MIARGGPGELDVRLARARELAASRTAAAPLAFLVDTLRHQQRRTDDPTVVAAAALLARDADARRARDRWPLLDLDAARDPLVAEVRVVARVANDWDLPGPLRETLGSLGGLPEDALTSAADLWLEEPGAIDPRIGAWLLVAAAPLLELAATEVPVPSPDDWRGAACPCCGGPPQVSVIEERSGEFLGGSPRWLVCSRCATWWRYPRAVCSDCGEDRPSELTDYVAEGIGWARVDTCATCGGYCKTFDLRADGARDVVPLVDDVASLTLDMWAAEQGHRRRTVSLAGV